jgi:hypothetical protein
MSRNVCISAIDGQTDFLIAELLLSNQTFSGKVNSVCGLTLHPISAKCKELQKLGVTIIPHKPGKVKDMAATMKESVADALCIIPPAHKDKFDAPVSLATNVSKSVLDSRCHDTQVLAGAASMGVYLAPFSLCKVQNTHFWQSH